MKEPVPMYKVPITSDTLREGEVVSGEVLAESKQESRQRPEVLVNKKIEITANSFSAYIARLAKERGGGLSIAEATSIYFNDLLPALRAKNFGPAETEEIMKKMGDDPYWETGKSIETPLDTGEQAKFDLTIMPDNDKKMKFKLMPAKGDALASQIAMG